MSEAAEFSRLVRLDELGGVPRRLSLIADERECAALAERFELPAITKLAADVALTRDAATVTLAGAIIADVMQSCVATGAPVASHVEEPLALRFEPADAADRDEVELDESDLDVIGYEGGTIDVGEAVAQSLSLALDPFPRAPDADRELRDAGVLGEDEAAAANVSPLAAALSKLEKR